MREPFVIGKSDHICFASTSSLQPANPTYRIQGYITLSTTDRSPPLVPLVIQTSPPPPHSPHLHPSETMHLYVGASCRDWGDRRGAGDFLSDSRDCSLVEGRVMVERGGPLEERGGGGERKQVLQFETTNGLRCGGRGVQVHIYERGSVHRPLCRQSSNMANRRESLLMGFHDCEGKT